MLIDRLHAHLPWLRLAEFLPCILDLGLSPEIAFKGPELDDLPPERLVTVQQLLADTGRRPTVHAPFFDLSPGAMEPLVRDITLRRLTQSLQAAANLGAQLMVIHPGYDRWRYPNLAATWADHAAATLTPLLKLAERLDCRLVLENIYEERAVSLTLLVDSFDSPWLGHCFDVGHWRLFGKESLESWLKSIAPRLLHLHLHDNRGVGDDHLPVGEGVIDFHHLFRQLDNMATHPSMTLEAHHPADLQRSLTNLVNLVSKELPR